MAILSLLPPLAEALALGLLAAALLAPAGYLLMAALDLREGLHLRRAGHPCLCVLVRAACYAVLGLAALGH